MGPHVVASPRRCPLKWQHFYCLPKGAWLRVTVVPRALRSLALSPPTMLARTVPSPQASEHFRNRLRPSLRFLAEDERWHATLERSTRDRQFRGAPSRPGGPRRSRHAQRT